jgi:hypothetical protein
MNEVRVVEKENNAKLRTVHSLPEVKTEDDPLTTRSPLPCHYFDYIVGTSTGGYAPSAITCPHRPSNEESGSLPSCSAVFEWRLPNAYMTTRTWGKMYLVIGGPYITTATATRNWTIVSKRSLCGTAMILALPALETT